MKMDGAVIMKQSDYTAQIGKQDFWTGISFAEFQSLPAKYAYAAFPKVSNILIF